MQGPELHFSKLLLHLIPSLYFFFYLQEICRSPALFPGDINSAHPKQGLLGDCWFLCACSFLVKNKPLLDKVAHEACRVRFQKWASLTLSSTSPDDPLKVMPPDQPQWGDSRYRGSFQFCFWQQGHWTEVMIDDRLPCIKARLCFSQCQSPTVFWVALLEKAYAKLVTCGALLRFDLLRSNILSYLVSSVNKLNLETSVFYSSQASRFIWTAVGWTGVWSFGGCDWWPGRALEPGWPWVGGGTETRAGQWSDQMEKAGPETSVLTERPVRYQLLHASERWRSGRAVLQMSAVLNPPDDLSDLSRCCWAGPVPRDDCHGMAGCDDGGGK